MQIKNIMNANELERWLLFLTSDEKTKEALAMESPTMKEAFEEIDRLSQNPETRRLADFREQELKDILQREEDAREEGIEQGIERGIAQGIKMEKRKIVFSMYSDGMSTKNIAKYARIPLEDVLRLLNNLDDN